MSFTYNKYRNQPMQELSHDDLKRFRDEDTALMINDIIDRNKNGDKLITEQTISDIIEETKYIRFISSKNDINKRKYFEAVKIIRMIAKMGLLQLIFDNESGIKILQQFVIDSEIKELRLFNFVIWGYKNNKYKNNERYIDCIKFLIDKFNVSAIDISGRNENMLQTIYLAYNAKVINYYVYEKIYNMLLHPSEIIVDKIIPIIINNINEKTYKNDKGAYFKWILIEYPEKVINYILDKIINLQNFDKKKMFNYYITIINNILYYDYKIEELDKYFITIDKLITKKIILTTIIQLYKNKNLEKIINLNINDNDAYYNMFINIIPKYTQLKSIDQEINQYNQNIENYNINLLEKIFDMKNFTEEKSAILMDQIETLVTYPKMPLNYIIKAIIINSFKYIKTAEQFINLNELIETFFGDVSINNLLLTSTIKEYKDFIETCMKNSQNNISNKISEIFMNLITSK